MFGIFHKSKKKQNKKTKKTKKKQKTHNFSKFRQNCNTSFVLRFSEGEG